MEIKGECKGVLQGSCGGSDGIQREMVGGTLGEPWKPSGNQREIVRGSLGKL